MIPSTWWTVLSCDACRSSRLYPSAQSWQLLKDTASWMTSADILIIVCIHKSMRVALAQNTHRACPSSMQDIEPVEAGDMPAAPEELFAKAAASLTLPVAGP